MKRLLKISFDSAIFSLIPIICWFIIGVLVDKRLINVFTLTYPIQFVYCMFMSVFSNGANVCKERYKDSHAVMSGLVIGISLAFIVFSGIALNIDSYISFMNMDVDIYRIFAIYSVIDLFVCLVFGMILNKLYFENKNTLANKYSIIFNFLKLIAIVIIAFITKEQITIVIGSLLPMSLFTAYIFIKNCDKFQLKFNIFDWFRYDSIEFSNSLACFLMHLVGFSNALSFGQEYGNALAFASLITDTQWDTFHSVLTVARIDISKRNFNYKTHLINAYKLLCVLVFSSAFMFIFMYRFYHVNIWIAFVYLSFDFMDALLFPLFRIKACYLQLEWSAFTVTVNKLFSLLFGMFLVLLNTPFCTNISHVCSSIYLILSVNFFFTRNYKIVEHGEIVKNMHKKRETLKSI